MKKISLLLLIVFFVLGCKMGQQIFPPQEQVESALERYKEWSIGRDKNINAVDIYFFYPEAYVFSRGKVCNIIAYCKTNRGDTIAMVDSNSQKQKIQIEDIKISQQVILKSDFQRYFNGSYTVSYDFIKVINAVDSVYLVELD
jgi:hypothetical protein